MTSATTRRAMGGSSRPDPVYVMGRSDDETTALTVRAKFFQRSTRRLLEDARIGTGMKVLDVGTGPGDVALLAAELVGPTGLVVGVDADPAVVAVARGRAEAAGAQHVKFVAGDIRETEFLHDFDAVVGRLVLMYSTDQVATLRAAASSLKPGGVAAFYEMDMGGGVESYPPSALHQFLGHCVSETFARAGVEVAMGTKLRHVFRAAGLQEPRLCTDRIIGGGSIWVTRFGEFGASLLRSMLPLIVQHGVATAEQIGLDTFEARYRDEVIDQDSVVQWLPCVGAWAQK